MCYLVRGESATQTPLHLEEEAITSVAQSMILCLMVPEMKKQDTEESGSQGGEDAPPACSRRDGVTCSC
ncbi:hypothetical protein L3Q82_014800 [Scortum barcoo]|uniref:Uncharacterized protein n=1 Tax=Scortum barcoo TaxID=214431 RepID=A0ACB8VSA0_9TELE|nr:hypothetical protein L3Q82_014800 [Scortum barcoo]